MLYAFVEIHRSEDMARAIKTMIVRGAPAIGVAAAYGIYLGAREIESSDRFSNDNYYYQLKMNGISKSKFQASDFNFKSTVVNDTINAA